MPTRSLAVVTLLAVTAALLSACGGGDNSGNSEEHTLRVVTTVSPITSIVENIGGTKIDLTGIIPEGVNSHTFEPPASSISDIKNADLIVLNGLNLEEQTIEAAKANKKSGAVVLLLGDETLTPQQYIYDSSFPRDAGKPNPHLWPDPDLVTQYAALVRDKLIELDAANKDYYDTNFAAYQKRLERLDQQIRVGAQTVPEANRKLLTYHNSWAYWANRYGFQVIGAIQPQGFSEPSTQAVSDLVEQIKADKVPAVFGSDVFPSTVLETISSQSGARYAGDLLDDNLPGKPGDEDHSYIGLMVQNMRIMIPALGGDASPLDIVDPSLVFDGASTARYVE